MRQTLIQVETPDVMRGRVLAVHTIVAGTSNEIGEFRAGAMAAFFGAVPAVLFGGVAAVAGRRSGCASSGPENAPDIPLTAGRAPRRLA